MHQVLSKSKITYNASQHNIAYKMPAAKQNTAFGEKSNSRVHDLVRTKSNVDEAHNRMLQQCR